MFVALAAARFAHFAAICLLFGLAAFPFYAGSQAGGTDRLSRWLTTSGLLAVATGALELLAMVGNMGGTWSSAFDSDMLSAALTDTGFGRVWVWRLGLSAVAAVLCLRPFTGRDPALLGVSGSLLASVALTGHSPMPGGALGRVHQMADSVHLLAAGWWIGGLLALLLVAPPAPAERLARILTRFSRVGYAGVTLLILSGLIKSLILVTPAIALVTTGYGELLLLKLFLFGAMLLLALSNKRRITPALALGSDPNCWNRRLLAQVRNEFGLGLLVLVAVGALGAMSPPLSQ